MGSGQNWSLTLFTHQKTMTSSYMGRRVRFELWQRPEILSICHCYSKSAVVVSLTWMGMIYWITHLGSKARISHSDDHRKGIQERIETLKIEYFSSQLVDNFQTGSQKHKSFCVAVLRNTQCLSQPAPFCYLYLWSKWRIIRDLKVHD